MFALLGNSIIVTRYLQSVLGCRCGVSRPARWSVSAPLAAVASVRQRQPTVMIAGLLTGAAGFGVLAGLLGVHTLLVALIGSTLLATGIVSASSVIADYVMGVAPADRACGDVGTAGDVEANSAEPSVDRGARKCAEPGVSHGFRPAASAVGEAGTSLAGARATARARAGHRVCSMPPRVFVDGFISKRRGLAAECFWPRRLLMVSG